MSPASSTATPCVSPHLMCAGSSPQSWIASNCRAPLPSTGSLLPLLSSARKIVGATAVPSAAVAVILRNSRRDAAVEF